MKSKLFIFISISLFFKWVGAMEQPMATIECYDGQSIDISYDLACRSQLIKDQLEHFQSRNASLENISVDGVPLDCNLVSELFSLAVDDPVMCKKIEDKVALKKLINCAGYLFIAPVLRNLTIQAYQCMDKDELRQNPLLKRGVYLRSVKTLTKEEKIDNDSIDSYIQASPEGYCLDFSNKNLESLSGLRQILKLRRNIKIRKLFVNNNKLVKLNYFKLYHNFNIDMVDAQDNQITVVIFPDILYDNAQLNLENNQIKSIPKISYFGENVYINLNGNPNLALEDVKKLRAVKMSFFKRHKRTMAGLRYSTWFMAVPLIGWSYLCCCMLPLNIWYPEDRWLDNPALAACMAANGLVTAAGCSLGYHFHTEKYKETKPYVTPKICSDHEKQD